MTESGEQYVARLIGYVGDQSPLAIQSATVNTVRALIDQRSLGLLRRRPARGHWSIAETIAHMADTELVGSFRVRKIIAEPGCQIPAFNQDLWVSRLRYVDQDPYVSLERFDSLRKANLSLFASLTPAEWQLFGIHTERGEETVEHIVRLFAGHDINHIRQIESLTEEG